MFSVDRLLIPPMMTLDGSTIEDSTNRIPWPFDSIQLRVKSQNRGGDGLVMQGDLGV
jgi:hypothetical protein